MIDKILISNDLAQNFVKNTEAGDFLLQKMLLESRLDLAIKRGPIAGPLRIISLGCGVQSSTLFLMACEGVIGPKPVAAIFADTQWERPAVYDWLKVLTELGRLHGIPVIQATAGDLRADALKFMQGGPDGKFRQGVEGRWASIPLHVRNPDGSFGIIRRQCTKEYKIEVIEREARKLLGLQPRQRATANAVEFWIGISADEAGRMRDSRVKWHTLRYPLIYDFDPSMTRQDCKAWLTAHGYPIPPKTSCIGCPLHSRAEWREVKADPPSWADAVDFDEEIRDCGGQKGQTFLHRDCIPLTQIDLSTAEDRGQMNWLEECEGMCGV